MLLMHMELAIIILPGHSSVGEWSWTTGSQHSPSKPQIRPDQPVAQRKNVAGGDIWNDKTSLNGDSSKKRTEFESVRSPSHTNIKT